MKVPASWQEAQEIASSIQLELDSIKFKRKFNPIQSTIKAAVEENSLA
jgi:hypothetical protein